MDVNTGLQTGDRKTVAEGLSRVLADTYTLYLKTHNYHWNVTGRGFGSLHALFMTQYTALAETVDDIAERIRALGFPAPGSYAAFGKLATIKDEEGVPSAEEMIRRLVEGHETLVRTARDVFRHADEVEDEATADLLTQIMRESEKTAWMLRSYLET